MPPIATTGIETDEHILDRTSWLTTFASDLVDVLNTAPTPR